tara:strand:+ start:8994 stop:10853 length:1860 start_codon:yes stop_codon:yes gene_type:complete
MMKRYYIQVITILIAVIFIIRLVSLQILNSEYKYMSENNAVLESPVYPERGFIYDRNGEILVANQIAYDLMVIPENTNKFDTLELSELINIPIKDFKLNFSKAIKFSNKIPSIILSEISKKEHAYIQEKLWKYKGFYLQKKSIRKYYHDIGANFLGYISEVNDSDIDRDNYYQTGELIGRQGIEKYYENILRGEKGKSFFQKDRFNRIIGSYQKGRFDVAPKTASNISLTIDLDLQKYGESLFKNKRGGIVAIEPSTGEILALVTAPSYDPNILLGRKRSINYNELANDTISKPLFDRGLQAQYSPGSPFKVLNALIGLQEEVININDIYTCNKGHFYAKGAFMECHNRVGTENNLISAIHQSCNTYFAKTYKKLINSKKTVSEGLDNWTSHLNSFGLGSYLGYDLSIGQKGFIPNSNYYDKYYQKGGWKASTIISNSIGQGEILTTPIQMANFTSAIANRGFYITPHFLKSSDKINTKKFEKKITSIDPIHFEPVIEGMEKVVDYGTARIAKIKNIKVCGKTGTVENFIKLNGKKTQLTDHSMFIAFAPKEDPKIALAVFVENGYWGSRWAAPIASLMIEKYLNNKIERKWLENRILKGSLEFEYVKPLSGKLFKINE